MEGNGKQTVGYGTPAGVYGFWKRGCLAALFLAALFFLAGCQEAERQLEAADKYIVGVVAKSGTSEYWMTVRRGMEVAAQELGMEIILLAPDSEVDEEVQVKMAQSLLKRGVDALAISPIDSYHKPSYLAMAQEQGIPVVSYDTGFADLDIPYIGIDNEKAGYELAEYLAKELGYEGQVGIVSGDLNQMSHRQRMEGFLAYMDTQPKIQVVFTESGYSNLRMSEKKIRRIRKEYPKVCGIMATSAVTAMGITQSIPSDEVKVVSIDVQDDAVRAVRDGRICALSAQSGYEIGYRTVQYISRLLKGGAQASDLVLDAGLLTRQNIESYMEREDTP